MRNHITANQLHMFNSLCHIVWRILLPAILVVGIAILPMPTQSQTGTAPSAYSYNLPAGWNRSADAGVELFTPAADASGSVQLMLMAPKPLTGDFNAQFAAERNALESFWGLRAPQATAPQGGKSGAIPYGAHFASYDSDGGPRYMAFLSLGQQGQFGMLMLVAASADDFNRNAATASKLFGSLAIR